MESGYSCKTILKTHAGQPTIVHFWGVTCGPCRIEMPRWGKLLQERPDMHLVVINADLVPNEANAVAAMLAETGLVGAENWMFTHERAEKAEKPNAGDRGGRASGQRCGGRPAWPSRQDRRLTAR
jgi:thiol-disulfide isomerase/thioredoxin